MELVDGTSRRYSRVGDDIWILDVGWCQSSSSETRMSGRGEDDVPRTLQDRRAKALGLSQGGVV
jgi:hypothetical protein